MNPTHRFLLTALLIAVFSSGYIPSLAAAEETAPGWIASAYALDKGAARLADIQQPAAPSWSSVDAQIHFPNTSALQAWAQGSIAPLYVRWTGTLRTPEAGAYTFFLTSDDGSRLTVANKLVVDNDGLHGPSEKSGRIELAAGEHSITLDYFNNSGDAACALAWQAPGGEKQILPASAVYHAKSAEPPQPVAPEFKIAPGQRISIVGNTLAERMQHDGWLETIVQSRFPKHELVFRNLGFSADELTVQPRVEGFGTQDDWLRRTQADVLAMFGFNESFRGRSGPASLKTNLAMRAAQQDL